MKRPRRSEQPGPGPWEPKGSRARALVTNGPGRLKSGGINPAGPVCLSVLPRQGDQTRVADVDRRLRAGSARPAIPASARCPTTESLTPPGVVIAETGADV